MASSCFEGYCATAVHVTSRYSSVLCDEPAQRRPVGKREEAVFSSLPCKSKAVVWPKYQNLQIFSKSSYLAHWLWTVKAE